MSEDDFALRQPLQEAIEMEIQRLSREYYLEPAEIMRLLSDWATWQVENMSWQYINRN